MTQMKTPVESKERNLTLDVARVLACFFVVSAHISGWWKFGEGIETIPRSIFVIDAFSRWCLPFFFMVCGAFNNSTDLNKNIKKLIKLVAVFLGIAIFYSLTNMLFNFLATNEFKFDLLSSGFEPKYHMWFLKSFILVMTIAPILNYCLNKYEGLYKYILILWIISVIIPSTLKCASNSVIDLKSFISFFSIFPTFLAGNYIGYFVIGKYLYKISKEKKINSKLNIFLFMISWVSIVILSIVYTNMDGVLNQNWLMNSGNIFIVIQAVTVFSIFNSITIKNKLVKRINILSKYTFFIYLMHPLVLDIFNITGLEKLIVERGLSVPVFIKSAVSTMVVFIITLLISVIYYYIVERVKNIRIANNR